MCLVVSPGSILFVSKGEQDMRDSDKEETWHFFGSYDCGACVQRFVNDFSGFWICALGWLCLDMSSGGIMRWSCCDALCMYGLGGRRGNKVSRF